MEVVVVVVVVVVVAVAVAVAVVVVVIVLVVVWRTVKEDGFWLDLVVQGASAACVNKEGLPALHVAVFNGHADAVQALVDEGADVNVRGPTNGNTALHEAVLLGPSLSRVIEALLTYVMCCISISYISQLSARPTTSQPSFVVSKCSRK